MTDFPEPLTPPDADLQDFPFMPLHVARLRDSDLAAEEAPEACWYAVLLWAASWHQLPAGSLPDNETVLCKLIGLGRDLKTFRNFRDGMLRGFQKCSDGRLYHPVVAEQVREAWNSKLEQRWRTECARIKKFNQRNNSEIQAPSFDEFVSGTYTPVSRGTWQNVPGDIGSKGQGQGQGQGQGYIKEEENPPPPLLSIVEPDIPKHDPVLAVFDAWNAMAKTCDARGAEKLTDKRRSQIGARIDDYSEPIVIETIGLVPMQRWLMGDNDRSWKADLDFFIRPDTITKIREGKYVHGTHNGAGRVGSYSRGTRPDPAIDMLRAAEAASASGDWQNGGGVGDTVPAWLLE